MLLRCTQQFGHFLPGHEVEVPDGAVFDRAYFEQADNGSEKEND